LKSWGSSSDGTAPEGHRPAGKKKPFAHLTWRDVLGYLEDSQEADARSTSFRSGLLEELARTADFFNLGTAVFLQVPSTADRLDLVAWTKEGAVPTWSLLLDPPLKLRLVAGIPQVLTGPEKTEFAALASRWVPGATVPIALPLVTEPRTLVGVLVLLDSPPFDLEEEDFVLAWTQYKYTLLQSLCPRPRSVSVYSEASLMRSLEAGHTFLAAELDLADLARHCDRTNLPFRRVVRWAEAALVELAGAHGTVVRRPDRPDTLTGLFVLPARMDQDLLWHQIQTGLSWPEGFRPHWERQIARTPQDLQTILGR